LDVITLWNAQIVCLKRELFLFYKESTNFKANNTNDLIYQIKLIYSLSKSHNILDQLIDIVVHVSNPELGIGLVDFLWHCHYFVKLLLVSLFFLQLLLGEQSVFWFLIGLFGFDCDWLRGLFLRRFGLFWLELGFGAVC